MCGPVTSFPPSVREVLLLWGVGAARRAAWASMTAWRHTVVVFPAVKFNPDSQKMGSLHKLLLKLLCLCSLCVSPSLLFPFSPRCCVLFLGNYIHMFASSSVCEYLLCVQVPLWSKTQFYRVDFCMNLSLLTFFRHCRIVWELLSTCGTHGFWKTSNVLVEKQFLSNSLKTIFLLRVRLICGAGHSGYP